MAWYQRPNASREEYLTEIEKEIDNYWQEYSEKHDLSWSLDELFLTKMEDEKLRFKGDTRNLEIQADEDGSLYHNLEETSQTRYIGGRLFSLFGFTQKARKEDELVDEFLEEVPEYLENQGYNVT